MWKRKSQNVPKTTTQEYPPRRCNSGSLSRPQLHRPAPPSLEAQPATSTKSVQAHNANSSSLNDMSTVVATVLQQIVTQSNGSGLEEDRTMAITKIVLKIVGCRCSKRHDQGSRAKTPFVAD
jgi:hypothetical protein